MSKNAHIREFLRYYTDTALKQPGYAVLLFGAWGSGKTWFIKDFVESDSQDPSPFLYVSLYGVQSFDELEVELYARLHPILGSKNVRTAGRILRGAFKGVARFDLFGDTKPDLDVSGSIPPDAFKNLTLKPEHILVLDDLERCALPVAAVLGYVNQFVEHAGVKAILLANEEELHKQDEQAKQKYGLIKEKLIGRSFRILPETDQALDSFGSELPSEKGRTVIKKNRELIADVYQCSGYRNLRVMRHSLWEFDRVLQIVDPKALAHDKLISHFLALFMMYALEVKSGNLAIENIPRFRQSLVSALLARNGETNPDREYHELRGKYTALNIEEALFPTAIWTEMLGEGSIPVADVNRALLSSAYFQNVNQPNWKKLYRGWNLSDDAFAALLTTVELEWDRHKELGIVLHVAGSLIQYSKQGVYKKPPSEILTAAKVAVDRLIADGNVVLPRPLDLPSQNDPESFDGLGFSGAGEPEFKELLTYVELQKKNAAEANLPAEATKLLKLMSTDVDRFRQLLLLTNHAENWYYRTPLLHHIEADKFVEALLKLLPEQRQAVAYTLRHRYDMHQTNVVLHPELPWVQSVATKLAEEAKKRSGKISSVLLLDLASSSLATAILNLKEAVDTASTSTALDHLVEEREQLAESLRGNSIETS